MSEISKAAKQIIDLLTVIAKRVFKIVKAESKNIYNNLIEKFRFSLTFKITLVYAHKTLSILIFFGLCIIGGFIALSVWNAQEHMNRNFYLVSDYLGEGVKSSGRKIKRLAELDALSITIFNQKGNLLYTTEEPNSSIDFYGNGDLLGGWDINSNYMIVKDNIVTGNTPVDYGLGYAMVLREEIQWDGIPAQIQIKNRMLREKMSLTIIMLVLLVMGILQLLDVVISGSKSSKKILKPIEVMTQTVENITINDLNTRLDIRGSQDELKDLARTFNRMLDRIRQSYERQNQFVSDASHELRTPIAVIQGYTDLLHRWGKKDEKILDESLVAIKEESDNMKDLVEKLLFLARGDKDTQKVEKEDFYLNELIDDIVKETKMIDDTHEIISHNNEKVLVNADPRLIKEALRIFIDNSIKYTPSGGSIKIESILKEKEIQVSIEDTGIGIPKKDLPHIFSRFYRVDKSRTKGIDGTGGTGLGLAIASWIIQRHGGKIEIVSEIDVGTKVIINLPSRVS